MDKFEELRKTIQELHDNNQDKPDVVTAMHFLLNLMDVLDSKERYNMSDIKHDKEDWEGKFFMMKKTAEFLAEKVPFWISTKEENPMPNERVLVYHSGYGITVGFMHTWGEWNIKQAYPENPTHWMPLPELPKDGGT